ncbi:MAG: DUF1599 domain-containing protein [Chitinophagaceae bacterium]
MITPQEITKKQYFETIAICKDIFQKKTMDYGTAWRVMRTISLVDQIFIKAQRIRTIQAKKKQCVNERISDAWIAIVNYAIIGLLQLELPPIEKEILTQELSSPEILSLYEKRMHLAYELMLCKNHDYGEAWRNMSQESFVDLILMKIYRMKQILQSNGQTLISEGLEANYYDILNYAIFAIILL